MKISFVLAIHDWWKGSNLNFSHFFLIVCIYSTWANKWHRFKKTCIYTGMKTVKAQLNRGSVSQQFHHPVTAQGIQSRAIPTLWEFLLNLVNYEKYYTNSKSILSLVSLYVQTKWALHPENSKTCLRCWCIECCTEAQTQNHTSFSRINNPVIPQPVKIIKCSTLLDGTLLLTHAILLAVLVQDYNQLL